MDRSNYLSKMKNVQENLLSFLESGKDSKEDFEKFQQYLEQQKITEECFKDFLHLLVKIANNHYRAPHFQAKIEFILHFIKDSLKKNFSNTRLYNIFKENKSIFLYLIQEKVIIVDEIIYQDYKRNKFFIPEFVSYFTKKDVDEGKICSKSYGGKRKIGENDDVLCEIIRNDSIENFISHVSQNNIQLNSSIKKSIFETNAYLLDNYNVSLIEYASFFGSIQIFNHLKSNGVNLTPSLWLYAIHSNKIELIHILEENNIEPNDKTYEECFIESVKCHHNSIAKYIQEKYLKKKNEDMSSKILEFFNFAFFPESSSNESIFIYLVQFYYLNLVKIIFNDFKEDINKKYVFKSSMFNPILKSNI